MSTLGSVVLRDVYANLPAASIPGRMFYATDTGNAYRDNGTTWDIVTIATSVPSGTANKVYATPNGSTGAATLRTLVPADLPVATTSALGVVEPDGTSITISAGVISAAATVPTGPANQVYATPNGSSGSAAVRQLVAADLPTATTSVKGAVTPDGTSILISGSVISAAATVPSGTANKVYATPNGSTGSATLRTLVSTDLPAATTSAQGAVIPDGTTITISGSTISATAASPSGAANLVLATPNGSSGASTLRTLVGADLPTATSSVQGAVKPDGTTITISGGTISASAGTPTPVVSYSNVFGSRALGTTYQNTGAYPLIVSVTVSVSNPVVAVSDASSTPTTTVWGLQTFSSANTPCIFIVQPSHYYKVTSTSGSIGNWNEYAFQKGTWTSSNVSGSRAINGIYQNTGTGVKFVQVYWTGTSAGVYFRALTDPSTGPTTDIMGQNEAGSTSSMLFPVAPGDYYQVQCSSGAPTVATWIEHNSNLACSKSGNIGPTSTNFQQRQYSPTTGYVNPSSTKMIFVTSWFFCSSTNTAVFAVNPSCIVPSTFGNPATTSWSISAANGTIRNLCGVVGPGQYYSGYDGGTAPSTSWYEYTIG